LAVASGATNIANVNAEFGIRLRLVAPSMRGSGVLYAFADIHRVIADRYVTVTTGHR
jgi:hypothetical protein